MKVSKPIGMCAKPVSLPAYEEVRTQDPDVVQAGDRFKDEMRKYCSTSKFDDMGYPDVYAIILSHLRDVGPRVLEVGIGINDPSAPSGMERSHRPGASLEGWVGYFAGAQVHGTDVDERTLVDSESYTTHFVDQLAPSTIEGLAVELGGHFDLIVDDGLHTAEANANTLAGLVSLLSPCGVFVVEDILPRYDELWHKANDFLPPSLKCHFYPGEILRSEKKEGIAVILWR